MLLFRLVNILHNNVNVNLDLSKIWKTVRSIRLELLVYIWGKDSCCGNTDRNYNNYDYDYNNNFGGDSSPENKMCTKDNLGKKEFEYNIIWFNTT